MNPFSATYRILAAVSLLAAAAVAQTPEPKPAPAPAEHLAQWPPLKDTEKDKLLALAGQFKKDSNLHEEATKLLIEMGEGALPLLMQQVSDGPKNTNAQLFAVFDALIAPRHAALLVPEAQKPKVELRRYLTLRLCRFHDPVATKLFASLQKDKDPQTAFYAQLGLLGLKQKDALPAVLAYSKMHWAEVGPVVAEVLTPLRSPECGLWVFETIAKSQVADQMAGLRLARYLMAKDQGVLLRTYLQAADHTVKREAVNAARVLHGEQPIENLPVFQAIEQAKQWMTKVGS